MARAAARFQLQTGTYRKVVDTRHSIKSRADLAFRCEPRRERKREPELSCITRAGQHSSVSIEPTWPAVQPLHNAGPLAIARARDLLFHQLVPFLRSAYPIYPSPSVFRPLSSFSDLRAPRRIVDLFPFPLFALPTSLSASYFALLRIILDRRRRRCNTPE